MSSFDEREEAFEQKFALEQEQRFKTEVRHIRHLGLWAAAKLKRSGDAAAAYAAEIVATAVSAEGHEGAIRKLAVDLASAGVTEPQIRHRLEELASKPVDGSGG